MKKLILLICFLIYTSAIAKENHVKAELITAVKSIEPGSEFWAAIKLTAEKDWHTYWRNSGDSGLPTTINWQLPAGFKHSQIQWPAPHIFPVGDLTNYGYDNTEFLLIKITAPNNLETDKSITLKAKVNWLACRVECIPENEEVMIQLPVKKNKQDIDTDVQKHISETLKKLPVINTEVKTSGKLNEEYVTLTAEGNFENFDDVYFLSYEGGYFANSISKQKLIQEKNRIILQIPFDDFKIGIPKKITGILVFENNTKSKRKSLEINFKL